eukprot:GHVS01026541.1.p1 GENE.GHVS01026541.1~~GHVS01026541.1.p1  ORF type:complete len:335 (+),score=44.67 GHVS01026541.1:64-1068(+)
MPSRMKLWEVMSVLLICCFCQLSGVESFVVGNTALQNARRQGFRHHLSKPANLQGRLVASSSSNHRKDLGAALQAEGAGRSFQLSHGIGRVALVTGAGRGIGRCIAETLAKTSLDHVICVDLTKEGCTEVVEAIQGAGGQASAYGCDVSNPQSVSTLCEGLLAEHGHVDVLVNNAGITKDNLFMRMKEKEWLDVINVNLNSAFYFCSPLVKRMIRNRFGRVINMSSVVGVGGNPGQANYAASKAGLIGFTKSLAKEVASRNITVNAIAPGFIKTQMTDAMSEEARKLTLSSIPAGRLGKPQEVADLVAFLTSDNAGYLTGKVTPLDGGMLFGGN